MWTNNRFSLRQLVLIGKSAIRQLSYANQNDVDCQNNDVKKNRIKDRAEASLGEFAACGASKCLAEV